MQGIKNVGKSIKEADIKIKMPKFDLKSYWKKIKEYSEDSPKTFYGSILGFFFVLMIIVIAVAAGRGSGDSYLLLDTISIVEIDFEDMIQKQTGVIWRYYTYYNGLAAPLPLYISHISEGVVYVGWSGEDSVHVTEVDVRNGFRSEEKLIASNWDEIRGLEADEDGAFAVILWRFPELRIFRYDRDGNLVFDSVLETSRATDFSLGDARLVFDKTKQKYLSYYKVHGTSDSCFPGSDGHEGDTLAYIDLYGNVERTLCWGCSHSMAQLLMYNPAQNSSVFACSTDCYPGSESVSQAKGGFYISNDPYLYSGVWEHVFDVAGNCAGYVGGDLGSLVNIGHDDGNGDVILVFTAPNVGQVNYNDEYPGQPGVGMVRFGFHNITGGIVQIGEIVWLSPGNEGFSCEAARIAKYGNTGNFIVGWRQRTSILDYYIGVVDIGGNVIQEMQSVSNLTAWGERDQWVNYGEENNVIWSYAWDQYNSTIFFPTEYTTVSNKLHMTLFDFS